jgi:competence protein ComEA
MIRKLIATALAAFALNAFAATDINRASQAELESVKGIGPTMSERIIEARKAGAFKDWQDLRARVKGMGERKSAKLSQEGLTVGGTAFAPVAAKAK